ncbi:hypothetical protein [Actinacidiphila glaucinigra]|uniref:hypothetical protein n=1 Tax=Actinacidiphila glaucinigra TaxID=235986 RepID=UPI0036ECACC2
MSRIAASLGVAQDVLAAGPVERTHLPVLVPGAVLASVSSFLAPGLHGTDVRTNRSERVTGRYPTAGLCLEGLPLLSRRPLSWRELPLGYWTSGPAVPPVAVTGDVEDQVCLNGLAAAAPDRPVDLVTLVGTALERLGVPGRPAQEPWGLVEQALVWRFRGRATATVQHLPAAAVTAAGIRFTGRDGVLRPPVVSVFHISQFALLRGEHEEDDE